MKQMLGIDIGGTGIKGNIVDTKKGVFIAEKIKYATPRPSTPDNVFEVIKTMLKDFKWEDKPVGCGFPSIVKDNVIHSAANIDKSWIGVNLAKLFYKKCGIESIIINDADAAGIAEMTFGHGQGLKGTVLMLTLGTGIGSGLFRDGILVPNTELGHLYYRDSIWEKYASNGAREKRQLSWKEWSKYLNHYLNHIDLLFNPDQIILGGGVSKKYKNYGKFIDLKDKIKPALMQNDAGIIGAAMMASNLINK